MALIESPNGGSALTNTHTLRYTHTDTHSDIHIHTHCDYTCKELTFRFKVQLFMMSCLYNVTSFLIIPLK